MIFIHAWENSGRVKISFRRASARELPFWDKLLRLWNPSACGCMHAGVLLERLKRGPIYLFSWGVAGNERWQDHLHAKASGALTQASWQNRASENSDWSLLKQARSAKGSIQKFDPFVCNGMAADLSSVCERSLRSGGINGKSTVAVLNSSGGSKLRR